MRKRILCVCIVFMFLGWGCEALPKNETRPNIVFILVDDLGYSDVGYMKHKPGIQTPNIDALAKSGMIFTQAYAAAPVCSPTRASILTGKSPAALKTTCHIPGRDMEGYIERQNKGHRLKEAFFLDHLPLQKITIAEVLKENGYTTGFFGKWHLAGSGSAFSHSEGVVDAQYHPEHQGFDLNIGGCAYGQPKSWFAPFHNATIPENKKHEYLTDRLGQEAVNFIASNEESPFLLYLSTYTVHTPLVAPQETIDQYKGNTYFAMIEKLDQNVGKVMRQLKNSDLLENTLVIFYSDNGGLWGNAPLRDKKGSLYEGGIRVPLAVSWPGKINAGQIEDTPVTSVDFFPTLMALVGIEAADTMLLEGESLLPLLLDNEKMEERPLYWHFPHYRKDGLTMASAIREGDWKLIWEFESDSVHLYNLKQDLQETDNLVYKYPEIKENLLLKLKDWQMIVDAEMPTINNNQ
ncbi:sulfatase [Cellulophaga sp. L1A9]|uniref:sulfatase n=1 Tax=Cellulophaga sp. L1A9 TaxID=2686362 RepID=UPI00131B6E03|nr:sulfatase [Cellulophaga sp. L1A9]